MESEKYKQGINLLNTILFGPLWPKLLLTFI